MKTKNPERDQLFFNNCVRKIMVTFGVSLMLIVLFPKFIQGEEQVDAPVKNTSPESIYMSIEGFDQLLGYLEIQPLVVSDFNGQPTVMLKSQTRIGVKILGQDRKITHESEIHLSQETNRFVAYQGTFVSGETTTKIDAHVSGGILTSGLEVLGVSERKTVDFEVTPDLFYLVEGDFLMWVLMAQQISLKPAEKRTVPVVSAETLTLDNKTLTGSDLGQFEERDGGGVYIDDEVVVFLGPAPQKKPLSVLFVGQNTTIKLADAGIVETFENQSISDVFFESMFLESEVKFLDFKAIKEFRAQVDLNVLTNEKAEISMKSPMQEFKGSIKDNQVQGTVIIRSTEPGIEGNFAFPPAQDNIKGLEKLLLPDVFIESDDPLIIELAKEITAGSMTSREAAQKISDWVYKNIEYAIADSPSAKLALVRKTGDCGPHANLAVALLRASGIPAKLVGGLLYFGGGFGQHAWVEVYIGDDQWLSFDPTTGEFGQISALHLKGFEGIGGVNPKTIKITYYNPKPIMGKTAERLFPWEPGLAYTWEYLTEGEIIGTEKVTFSPGSAPGTWKATSRLDMTRTGLWTEREVEFNTDLSPLTWKTKGVSGLIEYSIDALFKKGLAEIVVEQTGRDRVEKTIMLSGKIFAFENSCMMAWMVLCSRLAYTPGEKGTYNLFHLESLQVMPVEFGVRAELENREGKAFPENAYVIDVNPFNNVFYVTEEAGAFIELLSPGLTVRLQTQEK